MLRFRNILLFVLGVYQLLLPLLSGATEETEEQNHLLTINAQLSLRDLLADTVRRYPDYVILEAKQLEIATYSQYAKGILPSAPTLGINHRNDSTFNNRGEYEWATDLELPIWLPKQRALREALAQQVTQSAVGAGVYLQWQVAGLLRDALWQVALNRELLELAQQRQKTALELQHTVQRRVQAGDLPASDKLLAQNEVYQSDINQLRAKTELQHAQFRYRLLTGRQDMPQNFKEQVSTSGPLSLDAEHPALRDADAKRQLADKERELVRVQRYSNPSVVLSARSQQGSFDPQSNQTLGLSLRIPLHGNSHNAPLLANAESNYAKQVAEAQRWRYTLEGALHEAFHQLESTRNELNIVSMQAQNAQKTLQLATRAFALGESDLVNLLRVRSQTNDIVRTWHQRQIELDWAIARYKQAGGDLP